MNEELLPFDIAKKEPSIIKVIGVGGGGGNAVENMCEQGIIGVDFMICNTDKQVLEASQVETRIQLGPELTEGLGAGNKPEKGRAAAEESIEEIRRHLNDRAKMVFITAGMGGGTGTGAAPVIAEVAKELGKLTIGIVTIPFRHEGARRIKQAIEGIREMNNHVDALLVVNNEKITEIYGDLFVAEALKRADDVLTVAAKGIAEIITKKGNINVDFADVETVMKKSGIALMGTGEAVGEGRALKAAQAALSSPLLDNNNINGAKNLLVNITAAETSPATMSEITEVNQFVQSAAGNAADLIFGVSSDPSLKDSIAVTIIATGFGEHNIPAIYANSPNEFINKIVLDDKEEDDDDNESKTFQVEFGNDDEDELHHSHTFEIEPDSDDISISKDPFSLDDFYYEEEDIDLKNDDITTDSSADLFTNQTIQEPEKNIVVEPKIQPSLNYKENLTELEEVPAYKRRKLIFNSKGTGKSNEELSRRVLRKDETGEPRLRDNNSFLHDNSD